MPEEVNVFRSDCFQDWSACLQIWLFSEMTVFIRSDCPKERLSEDPKGRYLSLAIIYLAPSSQISAMFEQLLKGQLSWKCDEEVQVQNSRTTWCWGAKVVVKFGRVSQGSSTALSMCTTRRSRLRGTARRRSGPNNVCSSVKLRRNMSMIALSCNEGTKTLLDVFNP